MVRLDTGHSESPRGKGLLWGVEVPVCGQEITTEWLTAAMHAAGSLSSPNEVREITIEREEREWTASFASICWLHVVYGNTSTNAPTNMVVKMGGDLGAAEIGVSLWLRHHLPVMTAHCVFADFTTTNQTILITERVDSDYPMIEKCTEMAQLSRDECYHRLGAVVDEVAKLSCFRIDEAHLAEIPHEEFRERFRSTLQQREQLPWYLDGVPSDEDFGVLVGELREFCTNVAPGLFPLFPPKGQIEAVYSRRDQLRDMLLKPEDDRYIAFAHGNFNLDNVFWKDGKCGFFDWNCAREINVGWSLMYGLFSVMPWLGEHEGDLLRLFVERLQTHGGPALDLGTVERYYYASIAHLFCSYACMTEPLLTMVPRETWATLTNHTELPNSWVRCTVVKIRYCLHNWARVIDALEPIFAEQTP